MAPCYKGCLLFPKVESIIIFQKIKKCFNFQLFSAIALFEERVSIISKNWVNYGQDTGGRRFSPPHHRHRKCSQQANNSSCCSIHPYVNLFGWSMCFANKYFKTPKFIIGQVVVIYRIMLFTALKKCYKRVNWQFLSTYL